MEYPILESVDEGVLTEGFSSVSDRYYEHKYCTKFSTEDQNLDQRVSFHTNRLCMLSLAENHPVMKNQKTVAKVNFVIDEKIDRLLNTASGKGKRGAQKLIPNSLICTIECEDGSTYKVFSCIKGKLLEANENLLENPDLLVTKPVSQGYIALVLPTLHEFNDMKSAMLSKDDYFHSSTNV